MQHTVTLNITKEKKMSEQQMQEEAAMAQAAEAAAQNPELAQQVMEQMGG